MSWSNEPPCRRALAPAAVVVLVCLVTLLPSCGFQPLNSKNGPNNSSPHDQMAEIRISPLPDRIGQQMHNLLRDRLNPAGQPRSPNYALDVSIREVREELDIRKDETATRANLILSAQFVLRQIGSGKALVQGHASSVNSYNILTNSFATSFSESDARERALRELSDSIQTRLAIYFSRSAEDAS